MGLSSGKRRTAGCIVAFCLVLMLGISGPAVAAGVASRGLPATTTVPVFVRPVTVITTETTPQSAACQSPCECLLRTEAVAKWGEKGFVQCSGTPCATTARSTADHYCYHKNTETVIPESGIPISTVSMVRAEPTLVTNPAPQNPPPQPQSQPAQQPSQFSHSYQLPENLHIELFDVAKTLKPTVSVDPVAMPPTPQTLGGIVRVPVNVSYANNISIFTIQMSYWGVSRVWLLDVEKGPLLQGSGSQIFWDTDVEIPYSTKKEAITIMASAPGGVSGSGTLCYLKLWYHWDPTQERNDGSLLQAIREGVITVKGVDAKKSDSTPVAMDLRSGRWYLSVDPAPSIDCNRDGMFDAADAMAVKMMADNLVTADLHCDTDQNGKIDKADVKTYTDLLNNPAQAHKIGLT